MGQEIFTIKQLNQDAKYPREFLYKLVHSTDARKFSFKSGNEFLINKKKLEAYLHDD